jgi:hypothetical protein
MAVLRSATLTDDYVRGQLPLPGWSHGEASLRLPTTETILIIVEDGRDVGASVGASIPPGPDRIGIGSRAPPNGGRGHLFRPISQYAS